jgi:hypothetical protein
MLNVDDFVATWSGASEEARDFFLCYWAVSLDKPELDELIAKLPGIRPEEQDMAYNYHVDPSIDRTPKVIKSSSGMGNISIPRLHKDFKTTPNYLLDVSTGMGNITGAAYHGGSVTSGIGDITLRVAPYVEVITNTNMGDIRDSRKMLIRPAGHSPILTVETRMGNISLSDII